MSVSVIVPLYNKRAYITRALDSIAAQTFRDLEVIVVDDGSTDDSRQIAEAYPDNRFRVISQPNQGPGAARNTGIACAEGEIIAFLDADDEWLPNYLETNVKLLKQLGTDVACVTSGYYEFPQNISAENLFRRRGLSEGVLNAEGLSPLQLQHSLAFMSSCSTVTWKSVLTRFGGFFSASRCTYGEDAALLLKILLNEKVFFHFAPLARFHREASDLSDSRRRVRQIDPFLTDPTDVIAACPERFKTLLKQFLAIRASKTAAVLGYWGEWREARSIRSRYVSTGDWRLPYFIYGLVGSTPIAGLAGRVVRAFAALS
ncbi:MAG: glycosyltransferase family 2 protein [Candidatus Korobacteraceae bacterium]|jgi:glycosyltransferase involved in cell wall biosynthesis